MIRLARPISSVGKSRTEPNTATMTTISTVETSPIAKPVSVAAISLDVISRIRLGTTSRLGVIVPWRNSVVAARMPISSENVWMSEPMKNSSGLDRVLVEVGERADEDRRHQHERGAGDQEREERPGRAELEELGGDQVGHDGPPVAPVSSK